ncbi:MAG: ATP-binding protein, partial [Acidimicrobiia bacterium]|nr:ATP-binding protein [Acidimicrobiia bacterium]
GIAAVGIATAGSSNRWVRTNAAVAVAVLIGSVSLFAEIVLLNRFTGPGQTGQAFSKIGLWLLVGLIVGPVMGRLLRAERLISVAKAREELGRELHDGVLQTLAVIQRRSEDAELAALARDQENSLRAYLSDARLINAAAQRPSAAVNGGMAGLESGGGQAEGLDAALRRVAADAERLHQFTVQVVVATDCPSMPRPSIMAVSGAVAEALTNAAKHGRADRVTIYAEPDEAPVAPGGGGSAGGDGVFVSVRDNGSGFSVDEVTEGIGLSRSIRGRMNEIGGRAEISSRPGKGTEVKLWL